MRFTLLGILLLPLGIYLFVKGRRALLWATIASIPFFYTVFVYLPFAPVRPFQYFGGLLILRHSIGWLLRDQNSSPSLSSTGKVAGAFMLLVFFSLFMPALISEPVHVVPEGISSVAVAYENPVRLRFSIKNLTQLLYPLFGICLFLTIRSNIRSVSDLERIVRINIYALLFLGGFTILYQVCYLTGASFVIEQFFWVTYGEANAKFSTYNALGSFIRAYTPVGEPGYTGVYYNFIMGLLAGTCYSGYKSWHPHHGKALLVFSLSLLVLSGSTSGYFGFAALLGGFVVVFLLRRSRRRSSSSSLRSAFRTFFSVGFILLAVGYLVGQALNISLLNFLVEVQAAKLSGEGSGAIRLYTILYTLENVFAASPWFGVGYGSHRSLSLAVALLANIGIIGLAAFLVLNLAVFKHSITTMNRTVNPRLASMAFTLAVTHISLLSVLLIAKSEVGFSFGWTWLLLAMGEACYRLHKEEIRRVAVPTH